MTSEIDTLLTALHEGTYGIHELHRLELILKAFTEAQDLCVSFAPHAIREHFDHEGVPDGEMSQPDLWVARWVEAATDEQLREIGQVCLDSDVLWGTFHEVLTMAIEEEMESG